MSITINIKSDLEKRLRQRAAAEGFHLDDYIVKMLESQVQSEANSMEEQREIELLQKINMGLSVELWERYLVLKGKREQEILLPEEQKELIAISEVEEGDVFYGCVTIGDAWRFGRLEKTNKLIFQDISLYRISDDLEYLMKILVGILS